MVQQLPDDVYLLIELDQLLLGGSAFTHRTVVESLQLRQEAITTLLIKKKCIGSIIRRQIVPDTELLIGKCDKGYLHPHLWHGEEAEHELVGIEAADGLFLVKLTQYLRGEGVHRHHPSAELYRQRTEAGCMCRGYPLLLDSVDERLTGHLLREAAERKNGQQHSYRDLLRIGSCLPEQS